jgi:hypothetical protein
MNPDRLSDLKLILIRAGADLSAKLGGNMIIPMAAS